jgi:hypothetical protein
MYRTIIGDQENPMELGVTRHLAENPVPVTGGLDGLQRIGEGKIIMAAIEFLFEIGLIDRGFKGNLGAVKPPVHKVNQRFIQFKNPNGIMQRMRCKHIVFFSRRSLRMVGIPGAVIFFCAA